MGKTKNQKSYFRFGLCLTPIFSDFLRGQWFYFLSRSCSSTMNSLMSLKERYTEAKRT